MSDRIQFRRDNLKEVRQFLPIGIGGCRGVFSGWWEDSRKAWPDDAEVAAIRLPDGQIVREGNWVERIEDGTFTILANSKDLSKPQDTAAC